MRIPYRNSRRFYLEFRSLARVAGGPASLANGITFRESKSNPNPGQWPQRVVTFPREKLLRSERWSQFLLPLVYATPELQVAFTRGLEPPG